MTNNNTSITFVEDDDQYFIDVSDLHTYLDPEFDFDTICDEVLTDMRPNILHTAIDSTDNRFYAMLLEFGKMWDWYNLHGLDVDHTLLLTPNPVLPVYPIKFGKNKEYYLPKRCVIRANEKSVLKHFRKLRLITYLHAAYTYYSKKNKKYEEVATKKVFIPSVKKTYSIRDLLNLFTSAAVDAFMNYFAEPNRIELPDTAGAFIKRGLINTSVNQPKPTRPLPAPLIPFLFSGMLEHFVVGKELYTVTVKSKVTVPHIRSKLTSYTVNSINNFRNSVIAMFDDEKSIRAVSFIPSKTIMDMLPGQDLTDIEYYSLHFPRKEFSKFFDSLLIPFDSKEEFEPVRHRSNRRVLRNIHPIITYRVEVEPIVIQIPALGATIRHTPPSNVDYSDDFVATSDDPPSYRKTLNTRYKSALDQVKNRSFIDIVRSQHQMHANALLRRFQREMEEKLVTDCAANGVLFEDEARKQLPYDYQWVISNFHSAIERANRKTRGAKKFNQLTAVKTDLGKYRETVFGQDIQPEIRDFIYALPDSYSPTETVITIQKFLKEHKITSRYLLKQILKIVPKFPNHETKNTYCKDFDQIPLYSSFMYKYRVNRGNPKMLQQLTPDFDSWIKYHTEKEDHHPAYWKGGLMSHLATFEMLIDHWASALQFEPDPQKAFKMSIGWLTDDKGDILPKFLNMNQEAVLSFIVHVFTNGITAKSVPLFAQHRNNARSMPIDDNTVKLFEKVIMCNSPVEVLQYVKELNKNPIFQAFLRETREHIVLVREFGSRMGLNFDNHDRDKLTYHYICMVALEFGNVVNNEEPPDSVYATSDDKPGVFQNLLNTIPGLSHLANVQDEMTKTKTEVSEIKKLLEDNIGMFTANMSSIAGDSNAFSNEFSDFSHVVKTFLKQVSVYIPDFTTKTGLNPTDFNFADLSALFIYYILYINCPSKLIRGILIAAALRKLGILDIIVAGFKTCVEKIKNFIGFGADSTSDFIATSDDITDDMFSTFHDITHSDTTLGIGVIFSALLVGLVGWKACFADMTARKTGSSIVEGFKDLHFIGAGILGATRIFSYVQSGMLWLMTKINAYVFNEEYTEPEKEFMDLVKIWLTAVDALSNGPGKKLLMGCDKPSEIPRRLYKAGVELNNIILDYHNKYNRNPPSNLSTSFMRSFKLITETYNEMCLVESASKARPTPYSVQFVGERGLGKSTVMNEVAKIVGKNHYALEDIPVHAKKLGDEETDDDNYTGQYVTVLDEAYPTNATAVGLWWILCISNTPLIVNKAALASKGIPYTAELVLSCTNTLLPRFMGINEVQAVWRRRNMLIKVTPDEAYRDAFDAHGMFQKKLFKQHYKTSDPMKFPHLKFSVVDNMNGDVIQENLSFADLTTLINRNFETWLAGDPFKMHSQKLVAQEYLKNFKEINSVMKDHFKAPKLDPLSLRFKKYAPEEIRDKDPELSSDSIAQIFSLDRITVGISDVLATSDDPEAFKEFKRVFNDHLDGGVTNHCLNKRVVHLPVTDMLANVLTANDPDLAYYDPSIYPGFKPKCLSGMNVSFSKLFINSLYTITDALKSYELDDFKYCGDYLYSEYTFPVIVVRTDLTNYDEYFSQFFYHSIVTFTSLTEPQKEALLKEVTKMRRKNWSLKPLKDAYAKSKARIADLFASVKCSLTRGYKWLCGHKIKVGLALVAAAVIGSAYAFSCLFHPKLHSTSYSSIPKYNVLAHPRGTSGDIVATSSDEKIAIYKNVISISSDDLGVTTGTCVKDRDVIVNYHWLKPFIESDEPYIRVDISYSHKIDGQTGNDHLIYKNSFIRIADSDICIVRIPSLAMRPNIIRKFPSSLPRTIASENFSRLYYRDGRLIENSFTGDFDTKFNPSELKTRYGYVNVKGHPWLMMHAPAPRGSSGSPIVSNSDYRHQKIVGIQSATRGDMSYAVILTSTELEQAIRELDKTTLIKPISLSGPYTAVATSQPPKLASQLIYSLDVTGTVGSDNICYIPNETAFVKMPIHDHMVRTNDETPSILSIRDPRSKGIDPCLAGLAKTEKDRIIHFDPPRLDRVTKELSNYLKLHSRRHKCRVLSTIEAIQGSVNFPGLKKMDNTTSAGYPYCKTMSGKRGLFTFDAEGDLNFLNPQFLLDCERAFESYCAGVQPPMTIVDFLKDELLPPQKIYDVKTRTVSTLPAWNTVVYRQLFGAFDDWFHQTGSTGMYPWIVGINPESTAWTTLFRRLASVSDSSYSLDVSNWDGHMLAQWMLAAIAVVNTIYGDSFGLARETVVLGMLYGYAQCRNMMYQKHRGLSSGFGGTTPLNTLVHLIMIIYFFYQAMEEAGYLHLATLSAFFEYMAVAIYSDDIILSISPKCPISGKHIIALYKKYGIPVKLAIGKEEVELDDTRVVDGVPLKSASILSRGFKFDKDMAVYLAPLHAGIIESLCFWYRKSELGVDQILVNLENALMYALHRGRKYYQELYREVNNALELAGLQPITLDYPFAKSILCNRYVSI